MSLGKFTIRRDRAAVYGWFGPEYRWSVTYGLGWVASFNSWQDAYFFARVMVAIRERHPITIRPEEVAP